MKLTTPAVLILFSLASSAPALAEEQAAKEKPIEAVATDTDASISVNPETTRQKQGKGMMHMGRGAHGKGHGGMKHGGAQHGKGHGGNKRCGSQHDSRRDDERQQVVQRLEMIEARMAKIEAMLEILIRR